MYTYLILCSLAVFSAAFVLPPEVVVGSSRIIGGDIVAIEDYPYQVSLQKFGRHFCGGVIFDSNHVITAAHCGDNLKPENAIVVAGANQTSKGRSQHKIVTLKRHANYTEEAYIPRCDIAIIRVDPPFHFDETTSPIGLHYTEEELEHGTMAVVSGYGITSEWGRISHDLRAVKVPIFDRSKCSDIYAHLGAARVHEDFICAGYEEGGKGSCQGDSGGPLVVNGRLAGLVSYGLGCARPNIPTVFTNVAYFTQWLADNMA